MTAWPRRVFVLATLAVAACVTVPAPAPVAGARGTVFAVSNGWHVGLALATADLPDGTWPEVADLNDPRYVQVGWGDHVYYPARTPTGGMATRAALVPGPAVLHLIGLERRPAPQPGLEVLALEVDVVAFAHAVDAAFDRPAAAPAPVIAPGLYANSRFYPAHGRFHLFNTCNTWAARKLVTGGVTLEPGPVVTAEDLMRRLRPLATKRD